MSDSATTTQICTRCKKEQPTTAFLRVNSALTTKLCLTCRAKAQVAYRKQKLNADTVRRSEASPNESTPARKLCSQCNQERSVGFFQSLGRKGYTKTCQLCRDRTLRSRRKHQKRQHANNQAWRKANKERTKHYNAYYRRKRTDPGLTQTWDDYKVAHGIETQVKGKPSQHRKLHVTKNGIDGKACSKCKEWKPLTSYNNSSTQWDGLRVQCQDCHHSYRMDRREVMTAYNKIYWKKTKTEQLARNKEWKAANREHVREYMRAYAKKWDKKQRATNPNYKIRKNLRCRLYSALRSQNIKKTMHTMVLIDCSIEFLRGWLEAKFTDGMTWNNYGTWHMDHIRPCSSYDLTDEAQQFKCFHYTNLQPLWDIDNLKKGAHWSGEEDSSSSSNESDDDDESSPIISPIASEKPEKMIPSE